MAVPRTPANAFQQAGMAVPRTPAFAVQQAGGGMMAAPSTPGAQAWGGMQVPSTPGGAVPSTPAFYPHTPAGLGGSANPGTPANRFPGVPAFAAGGGFAPGTPAGRSPGTPMMPGTPSGRPGSVAGNWAPPPRQNYQLGNGLSTPVNRAFAPAPIATYQPKKQTWSDGSSIELRHGVRRKKGTKEKTGAPMTPASIPVHWKDKVTRAGEKERPPPKDPVPDFNQWKKDQRKEVRVTGERKAGQTPVPLAMPGVTPGTPGMLTPMLPVHDYNGAATPLLAPKVSGGITPFLQGSGITPGLAMAGDVTPAMPASGWGAATPSSMYGEATPFMAPRRDAFMGVTPHAGGQETPLLAAKGEEMSDVKYGDQTPLLPLHKKEESGDMTPHLGGGMTPQTQAAY